MSPKTQKAYDAWRRAERASENYVLRNQPETYDHQQKRYARLRALKERYEQLLCWRRRAKDDGTGGFAPV